MIFLKTSKISERIRQVLLCSILCLLLVLGIFLWNMVSQTNREMRSYTSSMTDSITNLISDKADTIARSASLLAQNAYVESYFDAQTISERTEYIQLFNTLANNTISEKPDILAISLLDPSGISITSGTLLDAVVLSHIEKNYPVILSDDPFDAFFTKAIRLEGRLPYYAYVMPVYDTDHPTPRTRLAACIVLCDLRQIQEILDQPLTNSFCRIQLFDSQSILLCSRDSSLSHIGHREDILTHTIPQSDWTIKYFLDFSNFSFSSQSFGILSVVVIICVIMMIAISITIRLGLAKPLDSILERLKCGQDLAHMNLHFNNELDIIVDTIEHTFSRLEKASEERLQSETRMYAMQLHLRESELSALQSQINPHFLYNTLECMRSIGLFYNSPEIVTISTAMTDIFRYSIKASSMVCLEKELDIIKKYLSIINIRFDDRFTIHFDIDPATVNCIIPKMTLQPIIENAIYHGLEPRKGQGLLNLRSRLHHDELVLVIEDNGIGMKNEDVERINLLLKKPATPIDENNSKRSIGLTNIAQRIILFSQGHCSIHITSKPNNGTTVCVKLPAKTT